MFKLLLLTLAIVQTTRASVSLASVKLWAPQLDGRIIGGTEVSIAKHPHTVSLRERSCLSCPYVHQCGGSIYNERTIITAAHCVVDRNASDFMIVAGTNNRRGSDGIIVPVEQIIIHEKYNASITDYDVAVVILAIELPINNVTIKPIALASQSPANGVQSLVTGWGATSEGGISSDLLLEVELPIVGNDVCAKAYGEQRITDSMLCAGPVSGGKDACQGDSGGPLVVNWQLAGIVSWGLGCARPNFPGVYANVAYLKDWIENTIENGSKNNEHFDFL